MSLCSEGLTDLYKVKPDINQVQTKKFLMTNVAAFDWMGWLND